MPSFRMTSSSNPFWFEDLVFSVLDEARRIPARATTALTHARRHSHIALATTRQIWAIARNRINAVVATGSAEIEVLPAKAKVQVQEAELLDQPLAWALATEPMETSVAGARKAAQLHEKAREQLGAITYVLDQIRDDLAPALNDVRFERKTASQISDEAALDMSIEALLALARSNAATRPKDRALSAAA